MEEKKDNDVIDNAEVKKEETEAEAKQQVEAEVIEDSKEEVLNEEELNDTAEKREDEMKKYRESKKEAEKEMEKLHEEINSMNDKYLRLVAEYDNFRRRTIKEKENIYADACADVLKEVLPVLDNLERAIQAEGNAEDLKKGVEMTVSQFKSALEKLGVEEIPANGDFNPNVHNAVMHIEDENLGANQIAEVFQKGYKKGEKILRHSMVKVAN